MLQRHRVWLNTLIIAGDFVNRARTIDSRLNNPTTQFSVKLILRDSDKSGEKIGCRAPEMRAPRT